MAKPPEETATSIIEWDIAPGDTLADYIDAGFKNLLKGNLNAKQLTDALTAATKWEGVKRKTGDGDGEEPGAGLNE